MTPSDLLAAFVCGMAAVTIPVMLAMFFALAH